MASFLSGLLQLATKEVHAPCAVRWNSLFWVVFEDDSVALSNKIVLSGFRVHGKEANSKVVGHLGHLPSICQVETSGVLVGP